MSGDREVIVTAPAKINLGLEVLGRRDDGYHEIRTILVTIGLVDTLSLTVVAGQDGTRITGVPGVRPEDNLITRAIDLFAEHTGFRFGYDIEVTKRIPSPGGLGGASSNAASTLMALNATHGTPLPTERMHALAAQLGADVPFFIGAPVALATGTGTDLQPLAAIEGGVVIIVPSIAFTAKTATLYGALQPDDYSDGSRVDAAARAILEGELPAPDLLANAFTRPLYEMVPELQGLDERILDAGAPHVALSGAGPGHYVLYRDAEEAHALAERLRPLLPENTVIEVAPVHSQPTSVDLQET